MSFCYSVCVHATKSPVTKNTNTASLIVDVAFYTVDLKKTYNDMQAVLCVLHVAVSWSSSTGERDTERGRDGEENTEGE